ncbi:MAG: hypothetical protein VKO39_12100 [Cyanobacteriota bacterium]|nr:hypothetical protein [Cyanobacteriota bacterium]
MSHRRSVLAGAWLLAGTLLGQSGGPARSSGLDSIVQAYCQVAVEQEIAQSGRVPPAGLADYACRCVVDRLTQGMSVDSARSSCRASTARRYSL